MTRYLLTAVLGMTALVAVPRPTSVSAQDDAGLAGRWTLNRELSQFPREIGFNVDWVPTAPGSDSSSSGRGGRGRRGSSGGGNAAPFAGSRESADDAKRVQLLTAEVRNPSAHLTIVEPPNAVTITDDQGQSRTFHPNVKSEVLQLESVPVGVTAKLESGTLVVVYSVEQGRELRYSYWRNASPRRLIVDVQFVERGGGDSVRRVYEPASATETSAPPAAPSSASAASVPGSPPVSAGGTAAGTFNQQPDAELKGLNKLGLVVEDLSAQATACGLNHDTLETSVSKRLTDAGFKVTRNSDEDTYVYVNVITTSPSLGFCVSRWDVFLYTHTTAKLSYQQTPVLVQVSLLHKGGIAGGAAAPHAESLLRGIAEYVDQFSARIRDVNK